MLSEFNCKELIEILNPREVTLLRKDHEGGVANFESLTRKPPEKMARTGFQGDSRKMDQGPKQCKSGENCIGYNLLMLNYILK